MTGTLALLGACSRSPAPGADAGPAPPASWFVERAAEAGIEFSIDRAAAGDYFMPDSMGAGCALFDCDGDGDLDLYLVNGFRDGNGSLVNPRGANRLYRQDPGGRFTDVTEASGAGERGYGMGVATGDYDNDGDVDLYLSNDGPDALLRNDGGGAFTDVTAAAGITNDAWSASAGFFDYDGDGDLDVYVTNYLAYDPAIGGTDAAGRPEYPAPDLFEGVPDVLYRNNGDGTFTDVSAPAGIAAVPGKGLGLAFVDLDGDGRVDVYVANDGRANHAWIQTGTGTFTSAAPALGLAVNRYGRPEASMGVALGDTDGDGRSEIFLTHLVQESNTLYRPTTAGRFEDRTAAAGLGVPSIDLTGFGTVFADVELDGDLDLVLVNGRVLRAAPDPGAAALSDHWRPYAEPNLLLLNDGTGRFTAAPDVAGPLAADVEVSRGLAAGDIDGDGDVDLVVTSGNGTVRLYRNDAPRAGRWLLVRAVDPALRRDAIGATVQVAAGGRRWRGEVRTACSYLSACDPRVHFGLGAVDGIEGITVTWPGGARERFPGGPADRIVEVRRGEGRPQP